MKRFYKFVSLSEKDGFFSIQLDGKPVKTPARALLRTDSRSLAEAIVREWSAQGDKISLNAMPMTQLLGTQIDRVGAERSAMTAELMRFFDTDLLCYRAAEPPEMARRQAEAWDPWLAWFEKTFGVSLLTTHDLKALKQPGRGDVKAFIDDLDDARFTVFQVAVALSGSLVLGLAFVRGAASAQQVFDAARAEEIYKAEMYLEKDYGPDPAQGKKDAEMLKDLEAAAAFLSFI